MVFNGMESEQFGNFSEDEIGIRIGRETGLERFQVEESGIGKVRGREEGVGNASGN